MLSDEIKFESLRANWELSTQAMMDAMPDAYPDLTKALSDTHHRFRNMIARRLEPAINAEIRDSPAFTYREKKKMSEWINEESTQFGLAVLCPATAHHSSISVERDDRQSRGTGGRFCFQHRSVASPTGREQTSSSPALSFLRLVPTSIEAAEWNRWDKIEARRRANDSRAR